MPTSKTGNAAAPKSRQIPQSEEHLIVGHGPNAQRLCPLCANIDTVSIQSLHAGTIQSYLAGERYTVPHHPQFAALQQSATAGCSLCQLFLQEIEGSRGTKQKYFCRGQLRIEFEATEVGENVKTRVRYHDVAVDYVSFHLSSNPIRIDCVLNPFPDLDLCASWLARCSAGQRSHSNCPSLRETTLPSRVLMVGGMSSGAIKLIETNGAQGIYACLSHCWGSTPISTRTLCSNLEQHLRRIPLEALPRTFRDAVTVCRSLGLPYLWIDSLCIVQDDPADWERECVQMCSIYQNSAVTIAASAAENASEGFLRFRKQPICSPCLVPSRNGSGEAFIISSWGRSTAGGWLGSLEFPPTTLLERAWVVQERLLSPRVLFFHQDQLYFDCFAGCFREAYPDLAHRYHPQSSWERAEYNRISFSASTLDEPEKDLVDIWFSVIREYSMTQLSYQSDVLPALSGLAKSLAQRSEQTGTPLGDYVAGLWTRKDCFYKCLLWYATETRKEYRHQTAEETLPSWSWASCHRTVDHFMHDTIIHPLTGPDIRIDKFDVRPSGINPYGSVQPGASIHMAGFLQTYSIRPTVRYTGRSKYRYKPPLSIWSVATAGRPSLELTPFGPDSSIFHKHQRDQSAVVCLSVCADVHYHWYGIVLERIGAKRYRRVGVCEVDRVDHSTSSEEEVRGRMDMRRAGNWEEFILV